MYLLYLCFRLPVTFLRKSYNLSNSLCSLAPQAGIPVPSGVCSVAVVLRVGAPDQQHQPHLVKNADSQVPTQTYSIRNSTLSETLRAGLNNVF